MLFFLIGFMGSGKSHWGKLWAAEYNIDDWSDTQEIRDKVRVGYLFRKTESELPAVFESLRRRTHGCKVLVSPWE